MNPTPRSGAGHGWTEGGPGWPGEGCSSRTRRAPACARSTRTPAGSGPAGSGGPNAHLKFSPYVHPTVVNGVKAVVVNNALKSIEPLAYHFVCNFAKDNDLQVVEACFVPPAEQKTS